ncbi:hypothetical protein ACVIGB_006515 [Bradyrhizobium sp. USDA 4341]
MLALILARHNLHMIAIASGPPVGDSGGPAVRHDMAQPRREMRKHEENAECTARAETNAVFRWVTMNVAR